MLIVAREPGGTVLGVQLSSKDHDGESDWLSIGTGDWDGEHRPSWVDVERILRIHEQGMRREATALDRTSFDTVITALRRRHGWR